MKTTILAVLLALGSLLSGCHSGPSKAELEAAQASQTRQAIAAVIRQHDEARSHTVAEIGGKVFEFDWQRFASLVRQIDLSNCPEDFRVAWVAYVQTFKPTVDNSDMRAVGHILADTTPTTPLRGIGKAILESNPAVNNGPSEMDRLELVCAKYGVQLKR